MDEVMNLREISRRRKGNARGSGYEAEKDHWYVESAACVDALLDAEPLRGLIWDPACGGGNVQKRCEARKLHAIGTDIINRGPAIATLDFLNFEDTRALLNFWRLASNQVTNVLTNPPFKTATQFVERALALVPGKVIVLQRLAWLEGQKRREFFLNTGLSHVWVHSSRQSMPPGGVAVEATGGAVAYAWFVWRRTPPGHMPTIGFLP